MPTALCVPPPRGPPPPRPSAAGPSDEDGLYDFLTDENADEDSLPDTLHSSLLSATSRVAAAGAASGALTVLSVSSDGPSRRVLTLSLDLTVLAAAAEAAGSPAWAYVRADLPAAVVPSTAWRLVGVRREDGVELRLPYNAWTT